MEHLQEEMDWLDEEEEMVAITAALHVLQYESRDYWVHPINERRHEFGEYHVLWPEISNDDDRCKMYIRMTKKEFDVVYNVLENKIKKQNTNFREAISPEERLLLTLRYLATGNSYKSLGFEFRIGFSTVGEIIKECCEAIWKTLQPIYMPQPDQNDWKQIAIQFEKKWQFSHCIGALDGKHVQIQCPNNAGSAYFNYKGTHSIVLLALVDANYKFTYIDVGNYGRHSDGGIFERSLLGQWFARNRIDVPTDKPLTPIGPRCPYVMVGDEAFPLKRYLMRPFSRNNLGGEAEKIFNYRLSRARRIVENAFGILTARWRIFRKPIETSSEVANKIIIAACCLHNYLRISSSEFVEPVDINSIHSLRPIHFVRRNYTLDAFGVRELYKNFFVSNEGNAMCPWQGDIIRRGRR